MEGEFRFRKGPELSGGHYIETNLSIYYKNKICSRSNLAGCVPGSFRSWSGMMELSAKQADPSRGVSARFMKKWDPDENLTDECRHLIQVLVKKIDVICDEETGNREQITRIKSLVPSLSTMSDLLHEIKPRNMTRTALDDFMQDDHGFTYVSVRNSELERFSAK